MAGKKQKIVVLKEGFTATQVANESVSKLVGSSNILDSVSIMETDFMPDDSSILCNEELGIVVASLSDEEAGKLAGKAGVESIEDDETMYALDDGGPNFADESDDFNDEILEDEDTEASLDIDEAISEFDFSSDTEADNIITPEDAVLASQLEPDIDDMDIDENGQLVYMNEPAVQQAEVAGIPRDKLMAIVKCILKCAITEFSGTAQEVPDGKIKEILGAFEVQGSSSTVQAIRDYITCGLKIIYAPQAWRFSTGSGVRVAVVDTGITPRHPDLRVYGGASFVPGVRSWYDDHYHGTHVAGTIAASANGRGLIGVAPRARVYAVKVLNRRGSGQLSWILNGLSWCIRRRMHIVNLSLGSIARTHNTQVYSRAYEVAGRRLRSRGILPVAAAGNSGRTTLPYVGNPARCPSFMAVGSVDCRRRRSPFSSYGPQVEICAPGSDVWSTVPTRGYRKLSGTSMASPHVAGVAALVKRRYPSWSGDRIRVHLWRTALDLGRPRRDWFFGYGQVNAYRAVR